MFQDVLLLSIIMVLSIGWGIYCIWKPDKAWKKSFMITFREPDIGDIYLTRITGVLIVVLMVFLYPYFLLKIIHA